MSLILIVILIIFSLVIFKKYQESQILNKNLHTQIRNKIEVINVVEKNLIKEIAKNNELEKNSTVNKDREIRKLKKTIDLIQGNKKEAKLKSKLEEAYGLINAKDIEIKSISVNLQEKEVVIRQLNLDNQLKNRSVLVGEFDKKYLAISSKYERIENKLKINLDTLKVISKKYNIAKSELASQLLSNIKLDKLLKENILIKKDLIEIHQARSEFFKSKIPILDKAFYKETLENYMNEISKIISTGNYLFFEEVSFENILQYQRFIIINSNKFTNSLIIKNNEFSFESFKDRILSEAVLLEESTSSLLKLNPRYVEIQLLEISVYAKIYASERKKNIKENYLYSLPSAKFIGNIGEEFCIDYFIENNIDFLESDKYAFDHLGGSFSIGSLGDWDNNSNNIKIFDIEKLDGLISSCQKSLLCNRSEKNMVCLSPLKRISPSYYFDEIYRGCSQILSSSFNLKFLKNTTDEKLRFAYNYIIPAHFFKNLSSYNLDNFSTLFSKEQIMDSYGRIDFICHKNGVYYCVDSKVNTSRLSLTQRIRMGWLHSQGYECKVYNVKIDKFNHEGIKFIWMNEGIKKVLEILKPELIIKDYVPDALIKMIVENNKELFLKIAHLPPKYSQQGFLYDEIEIPTIKAINSPPVE